MSAARLMFARSARAWASAAAIGAFGGAAAAAQFHSTTDVAVLYDAPSAKARPLFVLAKDTPLELIVTVEGWMKIRDVGGTVAWVDRKVVGDGEPRRALGELPIGAEVLLLSCVSTGDGGLAA